MLFAQSEHTITKLSCPNSQLGGHVIRTRPHVEVFDSHFERQEVGFRVSHLRQAYWLQFYYMSSKNSEIE